MIMSKNKFINEGGIKGLGMGLINTNSKDFKALGFQLSNTRRGSMKLTKKRIGMALKTIHKN